MKKTITIWLGMILSFLLLSDLNAQELWGMTEKGGKYNNGIIYRVDNSGNNYSVQFDFPDGNYPTNPEGGIALSNNGERLIGVTEYGGSNKKGVYFEYIIATNNMFTVYSLDDGSPGTYPRSSITVVGDKYWYGHTYKGGSNDAGAIFEVKYGGIKNIYNFEEGSRCIIPKMIYYNDYLYGIYSNSDDEYLFKFNTNTKVFSKLNKVNGTSSNGQMFFSDDHNYIYFSTNKSISKLKLSNGELTEFLSSNNYITSFLKTESNRFFFMKLHSLCSINMNDGSEEELISDFGQNMTIASNGMLYGFGDLDIKEYNPVTKETKYISKFGDWYSYDEKYGFSGEIVEKDNILYGTTKYYGEYNNGTIFSLDTKSKEFKFIHSFKGTISKYPKGKLTQDPGTGMLYGLTSEGGKFSNYGGIFKFNPVTKMFTTLHNFDKYNFSKSRSPWGSLIFSANNMFVGTTNKGGEYDKGTIFEFRPTDGKEASVDKIFDFDGSNGENPHGDLLVWDDGYTYGITLGGGKYGDGVLFKYTRPTRDKLEYTVVHDFNNMTDDGETPVSGLTESSGVIWGVTYAGGTSGYGILFSYLPSHNLYTKQVDFNGTNGRRPIGKLVEFNMKLYGVTRDGGENEKGTLFEFDKQSGKLTTKYNFDDNGKGYYPEAGLTVSGGKLYGMCTQGGANNLGTMYEFNPEDNSIIVKVNYNSNNGANPSYNSLFSVCIPRTIVPKIKNLPIIRAQCYAKNIEEPLANSNCGDEIIGYSSSNSTFIEQGTYTIEWEFKDRIGNVFVQNQTVIINDDIPPTPNVSKLSVITNDCAIYNPSKNSPKATDNCSGQIYGTANVTFPITTKGTTIITWSFNDGNGNITTQDQKAIVGIDNTVTVEDETLTANADGDYSYQWYMCTKPRATIIDGAKSRTLNAKISGGYKVVIRNSSCSTTSNCYDSSVNNLGTSNVSDKHTISIFPNPTKDILYVENNGNSEMTIRIFDLIGNEVVNITTLEQNTKIDIANRSNGVYLLIVETKDTRITKRIIKN